MFNEAIKNGFKSKIKKKAPFDSIIIHYTQAHVEISRPKNCQYIKYLAIWTVCFCKRIFGEPDIFKFKFHGIFIVYEFTEIWHTIIIRFDGFVGNTHGQIVINMF